MNIKVLGTGCANCKTTLKLIEETAAVQGVNVELEKIEDMAQIVSYGVMSTPGVIVDGTLVHAGGIPSADKIREWLAGAAAGVDKVSKNNASGGGCCSC